MGTTPNHTSSAWDRFAPVFLVLAVLCLAVGLLLMDRAAPETANLFDKRWDGEIRTAWDLELARVAAGMIAACAGSAAIGLLLRILVGSSTNASDGKARALMLIGALGIVTTAWIAWRGPFG